MRRARVSDSPERGLAVRSGRGDRIRRRALADRAGDRGRRGRRNDGVRRDRCGNRRGDGPRRRRDAPAARGESPGDHDHASPSDRDRRRPPFQRREDSGRPNAYSDRAARRRSPAGRDPPDARRPGIPADGAITTVRTFVEHTGPARLDKRTKNLARRLSPDDIAIIDHADLDRVSAEELVESGVRVVVNVAPSQTGRFPNPGPLLLVRGGVRLIDAPGADLFEQVSDGELLSVRGAGLYRNGTCLAQGQALAERDLQIALNEQRMRVTGALRAFAENTLEYLRDEGRILTEGVDVPQLRTRLRDRHVLVVARGPGHKRDLRMVGTYVRDFKPVLIAVDGGADALLEAGYKPDV